MHYEPGEGVKEEGYLVHKGRDAHKATGLEVAKSINADRGRRSVLYIPIRDGGNKFGRTVEAGFSTLNIPYLKEPAFVSKRLRWVLKPTRRQLAEDIRKLRHDRPDYGVTAVIYDDTVDKGTRLLTAYGFLKDLQDDPRLYVDDIKLATCMDSRGITHYQSLWWADEPVNPDEALAELRAETLGQRVIDALYSFIPKRTPEPKDIVKRIMLI